MAAWSRVCCARPHGECELTDESCCALNKCDERKGCLVSKRARQKWTGLMVNVMNGASGLMQLVTAREKKGGKNNFIAPRLLLIITPHDDDDG